MLRKVSSKKVDKEFFGYEELVDEAIALEKRKEEIISILRTIAPPRFRQAKNGRQNVRYKLHGTKQHIIVRHLRTPQVQYYAEQPASAGGCEAERGNDET